MSLLLPFRFQIALPLVHSELLDFTPAEFEDLQVRGLEVVDLGSARSDWGAGASDISLPSQPNLAGRSLTPLRSCFKW